MPETANLFYQAAKTLKIVEECRES